jgi:cell wall-associated NlpC family hydrolase
VKRMPLGRHVPRHSSPSTNGLAGFGHPRARRSHGGWRVSVVLAGTLAVCAALVPGGAAQASPGSGGGSLSQTLAEANKLSNQIDSLSEQYDGLRIQLTQAKAEAAIARENARRDAKLLGSEQAYINQIAVEGYMTGGLNPALQLLQSAAPQSLLNRASIMTQLEQENGAKVSLVAAAEAAAQRANAAAMQEERHAAQLQRAEAALVAKIQKKENFFNSKAYAQAASIFQRTGHYPLSAVHGDTVEVEALKEALTKIGDPYVWAAAGPSAFDCSGLVVWAYAQIGISLEHFTGDLWNEGEHVSRSELQPGDLVFFFADISHVGIYIGNGLMVDAPTAGQDVQIQPVFWSAFVGAVRIVA